MTLQLTKIRNIKRAFNVDLGGATDGAINCVISGWVKTCRVMKSRIFADIIDGSTNEHLQIVLRRDVANKPDIGSYITCEGKLAKSTGPQRNLELRVDKVIRQSSCDPERYPLLANNETEDGWYRKHLHLRPRVSQFASLLRIRSELELSIHMIMKQMDFFKVTAPILTSNDSEASCDLFTIGRNKSIDRVQEMNRQSDDESDGEERDDVSHSRGALESFFNKEVFLTTSAQLHLESLAASLSRVYCLEPTFRAEHSLGSRHLCEFTMMEAEEANVNHIDELMDRVETIVKFVSQYLYEISDYRSDLSNLLDRYAHREIFEKCAYSKFIRMQYSEAIKILQDNGGTTNLGKDINKTHERILLKHCDNIPIFITDYPRSLKPFYMKLSGSSQDVVACFDLIAPIGGEICGGSLREDNLEILRNNLKQNLKWDEEQLARFEWYTQLREFGSFPHGGFGLGLERLVKSLIGIKNIKDTIPFPRWAGHCQM